MQDVCISDPVPIRCEDPIWVGEIDAAKLPPATLAFRILCHLAPAATADPCDQDNLALRAFNLAEAFLAVAARRERERRAAREQ